MLVVQLQALVLQALGGADGQGSPKALDAGLGLAHHFALADLHQVADHQIVAAHIAPLIQRVIVLAAKGGVDAGVGVPGHVAVGGHLGSLGVDLVDLATASADGHHIGAEDLLITDIFTRLACGLPVGFDSLFPAGVLDNVIAILEGIIGHGAGELVEGTLLGVFVFTFTSEAVILVVIMALLAVLGILGDIVLQAHGRVAAVALYQFISVVVPFQLLVLGKKHAVGSGHLAVLRQLVHLGTGGQVQVSDVVSLPRR